MKKRYILPIAAALLAAVACEEKDSPIAPEAGESLVRIALTVPSAPTKAAGDLVADTAGERAVNRIDVFAFDHEDGSLSESLSAAADEVDDIMNLEIRVPRRNLDLVVIANAPSTLPDGVTSKATLAGAASLFTDNSAASFVMTGEVDNIDPTAVTEVDVLLQRIACKVVLKKVTKGFSSATLQAKDVKLKDVRLVNVRRSVEMFASPDAAPAAEDASYINPRSFVETGTGMIGAAGLDLAVTAAGSAIDGGIALYFYPNAAAEADTEEGDDYVTKLVMTFDIGGTLYRYPIGLTQSAAASGRNLIYEIENVTLTLLGNDADDSPNHYISKKSAFVTLNVLDWDTLEVDPAYVNEQSVFQVTRFDSLPGSSGSLTLSVTSRSSDMLGRGTALPWSADISVDGGVSYSSTFPSFLTLSATSGEGSATDVDTVTLTYDKSLMGAVSEDKVIIRFTQGTTGRIIVRYMGSLS